MPKKVEKSQNNKIILLLILLMFTILLLKEVISTYLNSIITLIPTVIVAVWFIISFFKKKISIKAYDLLFATMIVVGVLSGLIYKQNIIAIIYQIKSLSIYYLMFMIIRNIEFTNDEKKQMLNYFNIFTIILVIFSIIEILFQKDILFPSTWAKDIVYLDNYIRAYSLICNPNVYAFYLIFMLLYNYKYNELKLSIRSILLYALMIVGIILSISRSGLICLGMVCFFYLISLIVKQKNTQPIMPIIKSIVAIIIISTVSVVGIYQFRDQYVEKNYNSPNNINKPNKTNKPNKSDSNTIADKKENEETVDDFKSRMLAMFDSQFLSASLNNGRLAVLFYGLSIWKDKPLIGTGFSSFLTASSFLNPNEEAIKLGLEYSDNQYIALLVETGVIGILMIAAAFLLFTKEQYQSKNYLAIVATLVIAFFGFFINCLEVQLIAFLYFLLISLIYKKKEAKVK